MHKKSVSICFNFSGGKETIMQWLQVGYLYPVLVYPYSVCVCVGGISKPLIFLSVGGNGLQFLEWGESSRWLVPLCVCVWFLFLFCFLFLFFPLHFTKLFLPFSALLNSEAFHLSLLGCSLEVAMAQWPVPCEYIVTPRLQKSYSYISFNSSIR